VNEVQKGIVETQQQLASGKATLNAAETGVVSRMTAQVAGYGSVTKNLTDAGSAIDVAQSALTSISTIMSQLKGLATQASSAGFASTDRDSLNLTFQNLTNQIQQLVTSASVNGANLLNTDFGLQVTTGIDGTPDSQTQVNATNVGELVKALKQLLITGMQISDLSFGAANLSQPTCAISSSNPTPPVAYPSGGSISGFTAISSLAQTLTIPTQGLKAGDSYIIKGTAGTLTLQLTSDMTGTQIAKALADYLNGGSQTKTTLGNWVQSSDFATGGANGLSTTSGDITASNNILSLKYTGTATGTPLKWQTISGPQNQTITLPTGSMAQGNSITIGNLTFTAGPGPGTTAAGISPSQVTAALVNSINNGVQPDPSIGTFTTTTNATTQVESLTFVSLANHDTFSVSGLTFTASASVSAEQLATTFLAKINNPNAPDPSFGSFNSTSVTNTALGTAVSAGGSLKTIAWSYSGTGTGAGVPIGVPISASYTVNATGITSTVPTTIIQKGVNPNTGTRVTGGAAFGISASVLSSNSISLTTADPLTTGATPGNGTVDSNGRAVNTISLFSTTSNTTLRNTLTFTDTNLLAGTANLFPGDSVTINGLTFTASQTTTPQQVLDAFKNVINSGDTGNLYGTFANTDVGGGSLSGKVSQFTNYFTAIDLGNNILAIDNKAGNTSTVPPEIKWNTQNAAIANANKATQVITGQIDTVSTAQASLAAATAGIQAQLKNATNIKNGMQKTVDAIANIDPTALQANLQQLNTQQSVDYYLVSQMNTAAAAILSIFR
jgi:flagellin-like hook-associated protein FlgL